MSTSNRLWFVFVVIVLIFAFALPTIGSRVGIMTQEADGDPASTYVYSIKFPNGTYSIANNVGTLDFSGYPSSTAPTFTTSATVQALTDTDAYVYLTADAGADNGDKSRFTGEDGSSGRWESYYTGEWKYHLVMNYDSGATSLYGPADSGVTLEFYADYAAENNDRWRFAVADGASGGNLTFETYQSGSWVAAATLTNAGALTVTGALSTSSLDDTKGNGDTTYWWSADKIYDQLALKAPLASPTFTTAITMGSAGLDETELEILDGALLTTTQINYLQSATGTTGTSSSNLVFSASPTITGALTISAGALTDNSVNHDDINWGDIANLGENGLPNDWTLASGADAGNYDIDNVDRLIGADASEYIDLGADLVEIVSDTLITAQSPDIRLQVDSLAYLKVVTADGGITTISQQSDGTDGITIGDGTDNVIISADNWTVDTSGNTAVGGTLEVGTSTVNMSSALGVLKILGAHTGEDESILFDLDATANTVGVGTDSGVTTWDFGALDLVTTGKIKGGINVSSQAGAHTITAAEAYGTLFTNSNVADLTLIATPVVGMNGCLMQEAGITGIMKLQPEGTENLVYEGVEKTAGTDLASAGAATDRICWVAITTDHWLITSSVGTWGE